MPVNSISIQPATNSINAAYRPIVLRATINGIIVPPVVYCDIYINDLYYKTISKTQYIEKSNTQSFWEFDIQDAVQEYCKKFIEINGQYSILNVPLISVKLSCKFRDSLINSDGFIIPEQTVPIQGTVDVAPVAGTGFPSNVFYGVNVTLQHEDNQDLAMHLDTYKNGVWDATTYPLSHRLPGYTLCEESSDSFGILTDKEPAKLTLVYTTRGNITGELDGELPCIAVGTVGTPSIPDAVNDVDYFHEITLTGSTPYLLTIYSKPAWMTIEIIGDKLTFSGTPIDQDTTIYHMVQVGVDNCANSVMVLSFQMSITTNVVCVPITINGASTLPNARVGTPYNFSINLDGTSPYLLNVVSKPSWMTIALVGDNVEFTGTPGNAFVGLQQTIDIIVSNWCGEVFIVRYFYVLSAAFDIILINDTGFDLTVKNSNGTFTYGPGAYPIPMTIGNLSLEIIDMIGVHTVETLTSLPSAIVDTFPGVIQGNVILHSDPSTFNYIWFK